MGEMKAVRVTEEWQKAGVYYVRVETMCNGFGVSLEGEFEGDTPHDEYVLVTVEGKPASECRIRLDTEGDGHIERVSTLPSYQGKGCGRAGIEEAEKWLAEKGAKRIVINAREAVIGFYEKLGYVPEPATRSGSGEFVCMHVIKQL